MDVCMYLKAYLFGCAVFLSDASIVLSKVGSIGSRDIFECNTEVIISCKTDVNPNIAVLEINDQEVLDCQLGFCKTSAANYQNHLLSYDLSTGTFNLTKQTVQLSDNGYKYKCIGEFDVDSFNATVKVLPDNTTTSFTSAEIPSGTEIKVTTGCVFPSSEITISWFQHKVGSSNRLPFQDLQNINDSTDATSCAVGICGGNGVVTKQSAIVIQTVAEGCDYKFEVEIAHDSDPNNPVKMMTNESFTLSCNSKGLETWIKILLVLLLLDWCQKAFVKIYIQIILYRYFSSDDQALTTQNSRLQIMAGTGVILQSLFGPIENRIKWFKNDETLQHENGPLFIKNARLEDQGTYRCTDERNSQHTIKLNVKATEEETEITASEGNDIILPCSINSRVEFPMWSKDDGIIIEENEKNLNTSFCAVKQKRLQYLENHKELILKNITLQDAGSYQCKTKDYGSHRTSLSVTKPDNHRSSTKIVVEDATFLNCEFGPDMHNVQWQIPSSPYIIDENTKLSPESRIKLEGNHLFLQNLSKRDDNGEYRCYCKGKGSYKVRLRVINLQELKNGNTTCTIEADIGSKISFPLTFGKVVGYFPFGSPKSSFISERQGKGGDEKIQDNSDILKTGTQQNFRRESDGVETRLILEMKDKGCEGTYIFSNDQKQTYKFIVMCKKPTEEKTSIIKTAVGVDVTFPCSFIKPDVLSGWFKQSTDQTWKYLALSNENGQNYNLEIRNVTESEAGIYRFTNGGKGVHYVTLIVTNQSQGLCESYVQAKRGSDLIIQSYSDAEHDEALWKCNGKQIPDTKAIHDDKRNFIIKNVQTGVYEPVTSSTNRSHKVHVTVQNTCNGKDKYKGKMVGLLCGLAMIPFLGIIPLCLLWCLMRKAVFDKDRSYRVILAGVCCMFGCGMYCCCWDCGQKKQCSKAGAMTASCSTACHIAMIVLTSIPVVGILFIILIYCCKSN